MQNACNEVRVDAHSRLEVEKALKVIKQEKTELSKKLKEADKACLSAEAGLKTVERQVEDQCQKLHLTEIDLAIEIQAVSNLKAELHKTKNAARVAREVAEAAVRASYECGVHDTETRLVEEVAIVGRDYCTELWAVALDRAGVPANSELWRPENVFFPEDICEILDIVPSPEQLLPTQTPPLDAKVSKRGGVGKEAQPPMKANPFEDALTIRDVVS